MQSVFIWIIQPVLSFTLFMLTHLFCSFHRMMKLVQKRKGEDAKPSSNGKVKKAKSGGGIQSGLQAFFKRSSNASPPKKQKTGNTPPTSPENSDIEVIEIDNSDNGTKKRKQVS